MTLVPPKTAPVPEAGPLWTYGFVMTKGTFSGVGRVTPAAPRNLSKTQFGRSLVSCSLRLRVALPTGSSPRSGLPAGLAVRLPRVESCSSVLMLPHHIGFCPSPSQPGDVPGAAPRQGWFRGPPCVFCAGNAETGSFSAFRFGKFLRSDPQVQRACPQPHQRHSLSVINIVVVIIISF